MPLSPFPGTWKLMGKSETLDFCYLLIKTYCEHHKAGLTPAGSKPGFQSYVGIAFCIPHTKHDT